MVVYIRNAPVYTKEGVVSVVGGAWVAFKQFNDQPNGGVTVQGFNDQILSVQPDGSWEWRPLDTAGQYEVGTRNGGVLVYNPSGTTQPWVYPCLTSVV